MKNITIILSIFFTSMVSAFSQDTIPPPQDLFIGQMPDKMPEFPGGEAELYKYLSSNIHYPPMAREMGISGKVYISFIVDEEGYITHVKIEKSVNKELDNEAMRVIKKMPKWTPALLNGSPIKAKYMLPINFVLK